MKVFSTCPTKRIDKSAKYYRAVRDEILKQGHELTRDWIDYSINVAKRGIDDLPADEIYEDVIAAILNADVIIADVTIRSMAVGHQVTFALQKDRPVLLLRRSTDKELPEKLFIEGSNTENLTVEVYKTVKDIPKILEKFFEKHSDEEQKRFNLSLTSTQDGYISWAAYFYDKTKTEIIQDAIEKKAEKDATYKKHLSQKL